MTLAPLAVAIAREFLPPLIGRLAGPRREKVAKRVVAAAEEVLGKSATSLPPAELIAEINADANVAEVVRQELGAIERDEEELAWRDRLDARARYGELADSDRAWLPWLAAGLFGIMAVAIATAVWIEVSGHQASQGLALLVTIATGAAFKLGSIVDFYFGSSAGSKTKTDALAARIRSGPVAPVVVDATPPPRAATPPPRAATPPPGGATPPERDFVAELMEMAGEKDV